MRPTPTLPQLTEADEAIVQSLLRAHQGGNAVDEQAALAHITSLEQAYALQERLYAALGHAPGVPPYWKSGGPSRSDPMRHAPLPVAGVRPSGSALGALPLRHRWVEAEIALRLGQAVTPDEAWRLTPEDAPALVDALCVSIEVVDTRWAAGRAVPPLLKLADLQVHGALVLGDFRPFAPFQSHDWSQQECQVQFISAKGQTVRAFRGSLGVGDPSWVLPDWLRHLSRHGATVPAGTVVSTGTWCGLLDAQVGDEVRAEFPGIGVTTLRF
ncbi:2-keto-4-pentenoate hydratase [Hylemonella gracilis str. Niagara R]|uniref:2-keto-4-pentenoate hydratase n=1 Tax=Hylemonella gracilis str. Niagara R TaxID=1458275 RepID=A0A016XFQ5_9BURK|nr:fumarylacetoacetate hydrolase family protein [Hylemonella gracilis]EYC50745.1 2-keto-4-pentenoate hydratase [Hylemonella gracilis str. Niagara R]